MSSRNRRRPRVAVVYPIPFGEDGAFGGGERYAYELAAGLAEVTDTVLVTIARRRSAKRQGPLRVETYPWLALVHGLRANPFSLGFLRSLADRDVIHCLSYSTLMTDLALLFACAARRRAFVTDVGGGGDVTLARVFNVARLADVVLPLSIFAGTLFPDANVGAAIYGGVDTECFVPSTATRARSVLFVGRILAHKGINYLIEAVPPEVPLRIVGRPYDAGHVADLQRLAVGRNVTFVTDASDADLIAEYQRCGVFVLPSVHQDMYGTHAAAPELLGITLLEAMACGAPVVCTRAGSLPELVEDGVNGLLVPPNDPTALGAGIARVLNNPDFGQRLGVAGRQRVLNQFTWRGAVERCLRQYESSN